MMFLEQSFLWNWPMLYFLIGVCLCITEMFTITFYLLPLGLAALLTGVVAFFTPNLYAHVFIFGFFTVVFLFILKKIKKSKFLASKDKQYQSGLIGSEGIVHLINDDGSKIIVKIYSDEWEVYSEPKHSSGNEKLVVGDIVSVVNIHGNKISVKKI